ncbi:MAG TPA: hypothetical protein VHE61_02570 [Opitutaceae bacterium]|nr:hypothetical protein [Opitutaceae bacterium]
MKTSGNRDAFAVPAHARQLATAGYITLTVFAVWYWLNPTSDDAQLTATTIGLFAFGIVPMLRWVQRNDVSYPHVELLLLTTLPFYALPILTEHDVISAYPVSILQKAALAVLLFQAATIVGAVAGRRVYHRGRGKSFWHDEIIPETRLHFTVHAVTVTTVYLFIAQFTQWIPTNWVGTFRAVFVGIGIVSIFLQARFWGAGMLSSRDKFFLAANVFVQLILLFLSLMLVSGLITLLVLLIGYFSTSRRVPWLACAILLPVLGLLHVGKTRMRQIYWREYAPQVGIMDIPQFFTSWFEYGLQGARSDPQQSSATTATYDLMRRASLFQIVCVAVDMTPDRRPFLLGDSYANIAAQLVPRAIWPNKPKPTDSVKLLSVQLGLQTNEQADVTSIGFGMISEAYANFGFVGPAALGFVMGFGLVMISLSTMNAPTFSLAGVINILFLAWCLNAESPLVVWTSSLYQACVALCGLLLACKAFFK